VPAVIDAAYVNRVLAALDAVVGDAVRIVVRTRALPKEAVDRLTAVYADPDALQLEIDLLQEELRTGLRSLTPQPGNKRTVVTDLVNGTETCIFAKISRDYSAVSASSVPLDTQWVALKPMSRTPYNPTSWGYIYEGFQEDLGPPDNPCAVP
jgi:hypothetical protein